MATHTHSGVPTVAVPGPWLTGANSETYSKYATFGKSTSFRVCSPSDIFVYIDESPWSIDDGAFGVSAQVAEIVDWPTYMHRGACGFSFADGHAEMHRWLSSTTIIPVTYQGGLFGITTSPKDTRDIWWTFYHAYNSSVY